MPNLWSGWASKMRPGLLARGFYLLVICLLFGLGQSPLLAAEVWTADHAAVCYYASEGFVVSPPPGWGNLPDTAASMRLCGVYTPDGADFHGAPAIIYPRVVGVEPGEPDPAGAMSARSLEMLRERPDGGATALRKSAPVVTQAGLKFELYFIDNGPRPNNFELLACHAGKEAMLILVLSATGREERDAFLPDFMRMLDEVFTMQVSQEKAD